VSASVEHAIGPGTLAVALTAERAGLGSIRFIGGVAVWIPGARVRFP
jgi:hypothetical protein